MMNVQAPYCRDLPVYLVCPHCKQETAKFFVECDGYGFPIHRCGRHGDVIAIRSHVRNEASQGGRATPPVVEGLA